MRVKMLLKNKNELKLLKLSEERQLIVNAFFKFPKIIGYFLESVS